MALTDTEFINKALNICWITFKIKINFVGKLYKNVQKHYFTINCTTILEWEYTNKPQH